MWYSSIRWGRAPLNALTSLKVAGLATAVDTATYPTDPRNNQGTSPPDSHRRTHKFSAQECAWPWLKKSTSTKTIWKN